MEDSAPALSTHPTPPPNSWIDHLCGRFEQGWRDEERPRIEEYLIEVPPPHRREIFVELLAIELEIRRGRGELIDREDYLRRFPDDVTTVDRLCRGASAVSGDTVPPPDSGTPPHSAATATRFAELTLYRRGGLGALYRARDEDLHRDVVLKFIHEKYRADEEVLAQFRVEAEVTGRLDHPGVVPVYGIGQDWNGQPFYVMRMIHGCELRQAIHEYHEAGGPANRSRDARRRLFALLEHLASACNTVAYAHDVGIVHCDLKPANIMIGKYGETLVLDWGLATSFERTSTFVRANEPSIRPRSADSSQSGNRGGTIGYISPEQLASTGCVMPTSDVYSLGATLYEVLCGRAPFNSDNPDVVEQIRRGEYRRPREVSRHVPRRLEAIAMKAMSLAPADRYRTAKLLAADLKNWMHDDEVQAAPDNLVRRASRLARRHRSIAVAVFISLLVMTAAGTWAHLSRAQAVQEEQVRKLVDRNLTTALSTLEDLCQPLADGEMSNLRVYQPLTSKIRDFTDDYLKNYADNAVMLPHTARVYALRATVARVELLGDAKAVDDYRRAVEIYEQLVKSSHESHYQVRLARVRLNEGRLLLQRGDLVPARDSLDLARETFSGLHDSQPNDRSLERLLAEANHSLGEVWLRLYDAGGDAKALTRAGDYFELGKGLRLSLFNSTQGDERRGYERDLARSYGYLGDLHMAEGKVRQARESYQQSLELRKELSHYDPNPENRFQYARGLANFGTLERDFGGGLAGAIASLGEALAIQQNLVDQFGEVADFRLDLLTTLNLLAELHLFAAADDSAATDNHREMALQFAKRAEQCYDRSQTAPQWPRELALSVVLQALSQRERDAEKSSRLARDAEDTISQKLGRDSTLDADALFVQALARAMSGEEDQLDDAWAALEKSVTRGQNAVARIERHRQLGLRALAESPDWAAKLDELIKRLHRQVLTE
jgi:tetratricopeptide (TPR) repeat protein/tRNA A-37 threonylcarbamoyl transferase component Bud32